MNKVLSITTAIVVLLQLPNLGLADDDKARDADPSARPALFTHARDDDATFSKELAAAVAQRTPKEEIMEARVIHAYELKEFAQFQGIAHDLDAMAPQWDVAQAHVIKSPAELTGWRDWVHGLAALGVGDTKGFEADLKQAMWDYPADVTFFAEIVIEQKTSEDMAAVKVPLDIQLQDSTGKTTTLGALLKDHKAILVDFWASWCGPCMQNLPHLVKNGAVLPGQGVAVVGINTENDPVIAEKVRKALHATIPWLIESQDAPYTKLFEINSIPRAILIGSDGSVLFNGHPLDPELDVALQKLGAKQA